MSFKASIGRSQKSDSISGRFGDFNLRKMTPMNMTTFTHACLSWIPKVRDF